MSQLLHLYSSSGLFHTVAPPPPAGDVDILFENNMLSSSTLTPPATLVIFGKSWLPSATSPKLPAKMELGDWFLAVGTDGARMTGEWMSLLLMVASNSSCNKKYV